MSDSLISPLTASSLRVALLIGSEVIAHGLEALLSQLPDVRSVVRAVPHSFPQLVEDGEVDVLVVSFDLWCSLEEGRDLTAHRAKVLVVGNDLHHREIKALSSLSADGFLAIEDMSIDRLSDTLSRLAKGEVPMPSELAHRLLSGAYPVVTRRSRGQLELTPREKQTLALLVQGLSNKQIARRLGISTHGAKRLVTAILLKLGVPNRTAAAVHAIDSGLVLD